MIGCQCQNCVWYTGGGECTAFLNGIPKDILTGKKKHNSPVQDQGNDITFEKIDGIEVKG